MSSESLQTICRRHRSLSLMAMRTDFRSRESLPGFETFNSRYLITVLWKIYYGRFCENRNRLPLSMYKVLWTHSSGKVNAVIPPLYKDEK